MHPDIAKAVLPLLGSFSIFLVRTFIFYCTLFIARVSIRQYTGKSGLLPVFVNKVLVEHKHAHSLRIIYGFFCATMSVV